MTDTAAASNEVKANETAPPADESKVPTTDKKVRAKPPRCHRSRPSTGRGSQCPSDFILVTEAIFPVKTWHVPHCLCSSFQAAEAGPVDKPVSFVRRRILGAPQ